MSLSEDQSTECPFINETEAIASLSKVTSGAATRQEYLNAVVDLIKTWSGLSHIGIRVINYKGEIPFAAYSGSERNFWESESDLALHERECSCARVLSGETDPAEAAAMTKTGSFFCERVPDFFSVLSAADRPKFRGACHRQGFASLAIIPVRFGDQALGTIHLADREPDRLTKPLVGFVESIASLIAGTIRRYNIEDELRLNYQGQSIVNALLHHSLSEMPIEGLFEQALGLVVAMPWLAEALPVGCVFLLEGQPPYLALKAKVGPRADLVCESLPLGVCLCGKAAQSGEAAFYDRVDDAHVIKHPGMPPHGHYCVPIKAASGEVLGVLSVMVKEGHRRDEREMMFLMAAANVLAGATERRRTITALRDSEERFNRSQQIARLGSWEVNLKTTQVWWSDELYAIFGRKPTDYPASYENFIKVVHPEDKEAVRTRVEAAQQSVQPFALDHRVLLPSGAARVINSQAVFEKDQSGAPIRLLGASLDITERKSLEQQLLQSQKMDALGRLAGGVAHDFNNLLSVIISYAGFAAEAAESDAPLKADIEEVIKAGQRATALTRQLLAFSRRSVVEPEVLDLNHIITNMEKLLKRTVSEQINLVVAPAKELWDILADPGQLEQVLLNLVVNARDAMPHGGTITIETCNAVLGESSVREFQNVVPGKYVLLSVKDTGTGMTPEVMVHIFEPFFTTKEKGHGTGIGLATVFGVVKQFRGHIEVESEPGKGTTFSLYFPATEAQRQATTVAPLITTLAGRGEIILVVEDDAAVRALAMRILIKNGYVAVEAQNAGEALLVCEADRFQPALVLTDVVLPKMSGPDLVERLSKTCRQPFKVLYMSGYTEEIVVKEGVAAGDVRFLAKPFTEETLLRKVRETLPV